VLRGDAFAVAQELAHARLHFLIGQGRACALVQVVGPRGDDEALDLA
jgi:hypothetical protein